MLCAGKAGFTLIELLVVLTIISIIASIAVFSVTDNNSLILRKEAERMLGALEMAEDIAQNDGADIGIVLTKTSYGFVEYSKGGWQESAEKNLRGYTLPGSITLKLTSQDKSEELPASVAPGAAPRIMLYSSGEKTPFTISLTSANNRFELSLSSDGIAPIRLHEVDK